MKTIHLLPGSTSRHSSTQGKDEVICVWQFPGEGAIAQPNQSIHELLISTSSYFSGNRTACQLDDSCLRASFLLFVGRREICGDCR